MFTKSVSFDALWGKFRVCGAQLALSGKGCELLALAGTEEKPLEQDDWNRMNRNFAFEEHLSNGTEAKSNH